jgi:cephalosporin hydroxylase
VILIDTSHEYSHTRAEIAVWAPRLSAGGVLLFHDTNLDAWFRRLDGKIEPGWDNARGVIRAIEELVGRSYDERTFFVDRAGGYAVRHVPWSSGFTILRKLD